MGIRVMTGRRRAVMTAFALAAAMAAVAGVAQAATGRTAGTARAATGGPQPIGVVHTVSPAAQQATRAFWTPSRLATATPEQGIKSNTTPGPPPGTPTATKFSGVPTVGALFFTTGTRKHFCTASVVNSPTANLILTAAHCVYSGTYASNIEYVPQYHGGLQPYGAWAVQGITVATGWQQSHDPDLDFAFLSVAPPPGSHRPIQSVTGGLWLGPDRGYSHPIEVIGYNDTDNKPVGCATSSFEFNADQMEFYCQDYWSGTSGGPWILGYNPRTGAGTVFGVIGGYEQGGNYKWASYSAYFGWQALRLIMQAEGQLGWSRSPTHRARLPLP
jgi:V8-like Glu-specific endopeptidase